MASVYWNDVETLGKIARVLPYVLIVMGFVVAASGQFFKGIVDARIKELEKAAETARKNTGPVVDGVPCTFSDFWQEIAGSGYK